MSFRFFYLMIIGVLLFTVDGLGQNKINDGVTVKVFRIKSKKEVPQKELLSDKGVFFCCDRDKEDDLDRIEISSKEGLSFYIQIEDTESKEILLKSQNMLIYNNKVVVYHVYPWLKKCDINYSKTVKVISNEEVVFEFRYSSDFCY